MKTKNWRADADARERDALPLPKAKRKYIVESIGQAVVSSSRGPRHYTNAVWAVSKADARTSEVFRLLGKHGNVSVRIISIELDPHA